MRCGPGSDVITPPAYDLLFSDTIVHFHVVGRTLRGLLAKSDLTFRTGPFSDQLPHLPPTWGLLSANKYAWGELPSQRTVVL